MDDLISLQAKVYYRNWPKHGNFSKCNTVITQDYHKKGRTVSKLCYNNHVLAYYKNKFGPISPPKTHASTQTDFSNKQYSSEKQDSSNKQVSSNKQDNSNKQDR